MHNDIQRVIRELLNRQKVGVLATQADLQPYCNLIAFTPAEDLRILLFTTPRATQKYRNLVRNPQVAFLVDNRSESGIDFSSGIAVTALGRVTEAAPEQSIILKQQHCSRHTILYDFINDPGCAVFQLQVSTYILVSGISDTRTLAMR